MIKFFEPVMLSGTDYYPFGMAMRVGGDNKYRYGFNGKENDNETEGWSSIDLDKTGKGRGGGRVIWRENEAGDIEIKWFVY